MNTHIINEIAADLKIRNSQIEAVLKLLEEGNTVPFIARYRKEVTGSLDEEVIRKISSYYEYEVSLLKRKEDVIRLIDERGMLTEDLKTEILACKKLVDVEDLYRPYKEKKKTKATEAIKNGLEPLSKMIMDSVKNIDEEAKKFINDKIKTSEEALEGARNIISEIISDKADYRKYIRNYIFNNGLLVSKIKKNAQDEKKVYEIYYDFQERVLQIKPHRILAVNRGESENILSVSINVDDEIIKNYLNDKFNKVTDPRCGELIKEAINDSYKRLIFPSVEREVRSELKEIAENQAISNFALNLENLLLTPPIKEKVVLGFDPAFRTGCKLAVLDKFGKVLEIAVIYPTEPHNKILESEQKVLELIDKYNIDIIAIGNGTASRESEKFISETIKKSSRKVEYIIVNESGASVYSASDEAIKEFPDLTVEKRSAISIGRRLQDALSELVKIDPKSIGVGLYQHDVSPKELDNSLNFTVTKIVNQVGVNVNSASKSILRYISGLTKKTIDDLIDYRDKHGKINNRNELKKIKSINDKIFEQAAGFLRIDGGDNNLDRTGIHPESYSIANEIINTYNLSKYELGSKEIIDEINKINVIEFATSKNYNLITVNDILDNLKKPVRDPRDMLQKPLLKSDILDIKDLTLGMKLSGTVRNVVDFGVFIDIGLHNDGLAHISKLSNKFINHPSEVVSVGDIVDCYIIDISLEKEKVSLSLLN